MSAAWAEAGYGIAKEYVMHWVSGAVLDSDDSRSGLSDTHLKSSPWELKEFFKLMTAVALEKPRSV